MRYYIISGEASGDLHGSNLIKGLKSIDKEAQIRAWGGDLMREAGADIVKHYKECAIMGFIEVAAHINKILSNINFCKKDILFWQPDVVILIDYPGFNFKIAKFAKQHGFKVFYYIAPKVWAWREKRVKYLQKYVDKLFIIFPFEIDYFKKWGINAIYRGNPLIDSIQTCDLNTEFSLSLLKSDKPIIALLAGSRMMEIKFLLHRLLIATEQLKNYRLILAAAPSIDKEVYERIIAKHSKKHPNSQPIEIIYNNTYQILNAARAAVISSGTASLEAAIIGTPQVVCYGGNPISFAIAKKFVKLKYISLANLILNKGIFKELLQNECTPESILAELDKLLNNDKYREEMRENYFKVKEILGGSGASQKIASAIINELQ